MGDTFLWHSSNTNLVELSLLWQSDYTLLCFSFNSGIKSFASKICWWRVGEARYYYCSSRTFSLPAILYGDICSRHCCLFFTDIQTVHSYLYLSWLSEHKLFIGMLPKNVTDTELTDLFSKYGNVKDLQILRGSQQTSKGNILQRSCFPYE